MIQSGYYESQVHQISRLVYPFKDLTERIIASKQFIDTHFAEKIFVSELAEKACFSTYHFIRVFRNYYGRTPHQYLISVRIRAASQMLCAGIAVKDTCNFCGFENLPWFTEVFRKAMGAPPAAFRKSKIRTIKRSPV